MDSAFVLLFFIPLSFLALLVFFHWLLRWLVPRVQSPQTQLISLIGLLGVLYFFSIFAEHSLPLVDRLIQTGFSFTIFLALAYSYFHVFNMSHTARRIQILIQSIQATTKPLTYSPEEILERRMERLLAMGAIEEKQNRFYAKKGLLLCVSKVFHRMYFWFY